MTTIIEKIKKGIEAVINAWRNKLIAFKKWLERVKTIILSKILIKLSNHVIEGYSQQLTDIKERIDEFDKLPPKDKLEKIVNLAKTVETIPETHLSKLTNFLNITSNKGVEKIAPLAEAVEAFEEQGVKVEKIETLAKIARSIDVRSLNKLEKIERLEKIFNLRDYEENELKNLERNVYIIKWFLNPNEMELRVPVSGLSGLDEAKKQEVYEKIGSEEERKFYISFLFYTGCELLKRGEFKEADVNFDQITTLNNNLRGAWLNRGVALGNMKRYKDEIECYKKAIKLNPSYAIAYYNKGLALINLHRQEEANNCFKKAKELNPKLDYYGELNGR
jgi:tetratricopeptide (TPR) repeat protein